MAVHVRADKDSASGGAYDCAAQQAVSQLTLAYSVKSVTLNAVANTREGTRAPVHGS